MAATKRPHVRLAHIRDELAWLLPAFQGMAFEAFASDMMRVRAVEHALLIISEAVNSLPPELTKAYPNIEWGKVRGLGNVLRHDYEHVEPLILWRIIHDNLPELALVIHQMLAELDS